VRARQVRKGVELKISFSPSSLEHMYGDPVLIKQWLGKCAEQWLERVGSSRHRF
jgi:hypothetical protein